MTRESGKIPRTSARLAVADAVARDRLAGGAGNRTHLRDAATVRVHYQSATTVPIGGIVGFLRPTGDPDVDNTELARFVRDATIQSVRPVGVAGVADGWWFAVLEVGL